MSGHPTADNSVSTSWCHLHRNATAYYLPFLHGVRSKVFMVYGFNVHGSVLKQAMELCL